MEKSPLLSIIIVSYNTQKLLADCVASIQKYVSVPYEIIIVDNASSDGSQQFIEKLKNKRIQLIKNTGNAGFAKANNQGFKKAKGEFILLLNSDTYLTEDCITPCIEALSRNDNVGVVSCRLRNSDGTLQPTGGYFPTPLKLFMWMSFLDDIPLLSNIVKPFHPSASFYKNDMSLDWLTGAFFMFPKKITKTIGVLDEDYFMYVEEMDFCFRAKARGMTNHYLHNYSLVHLGRASSTNEFAIVSEFKNILLFYKKNIPDRVAFARYTLKLGVLLRIILFGILGRTGQRKIYEKAIRSI